MKCYPNVIVADAEYIDKVAFDLTVNFERMIGRQIPQADMARWADCIALDGGLREGQNTTRIVLIHEKGSERLKNFMPGNFEKELNGMAFNDHLGEFVFETYPVEAITTKAGFFTDAVQMLLQQEEVKRLMLIPDDSYYNLLQSSLRHIPADKTATVFAMQPMPGGPFRQEILGYSLMAALGIRSNEITPN